MQMAHNIEEPGGELIERFIEEQLAGQVRGEDHSFVPRNFAKEFSDRILPLIPEIREMVQGAVHDIRSMLPMKKQLQLAGEMMGFQTAVDAFEETMKKWSSGEVANYDDPFHQQRMEKNEKGETQGLRWARQMAENGIRQSHGKEWKRYVDKFKALYKLDAAQMATAESMLREYVDREQTITAESGWKQRIYRDQLWLNLSYHLPQGRDNPACALFEDDLASAKAPFERLDEEFKMRLESIPTDDQRRIADEMITKLLKNKGLEAPDTRPESASSRAEPTESEP